MKRITFPLVCSFLIFAISAYSESKAVPDPVAKEVSSFFETLQKNEVEKAYQLIMEGSPIGTTSQQVQNLMNQTKNAISLYGSFGSYEFLSTESIGTSVIRITYITKNQGYPLRWAFTYYKPGQSWILIHVVFDDKIEPLFK